MTLRGTAVMAELPWSSPTIELSEAGAAQQVSLRLRPPFPAYLAGIALPLAPNRVATTGTSRALWLGPDEWLIVTEVETSGMLQRLERATVGRRAAISDLSSSRIVVEVAGSGARYLLAAGCGLDLHPRAFGPGQCAQTLLARVPVILDQLDAPRYRVLVRRSYAHWLVEWLIDAAEGLADAIAADEPRPAADG
jgi:sarcosine oxidase, subunit gamma